MGLKCTLYPTFRLRWTCKSTRALSAELRKRGYEASHDLVARLLKKEGYSLQAPRKNLEGANHPDRNAQFEYIYDKIKNFQDHGEPVISVDTKKRELAGNFKNGGGEYGVYDISGNLGFINLGTTKDASKFAAESIRRWWRSMGREAHPFAERLLITADGGGSNGYRRRLWKTELQKLANDIGISITVCHLPPGTSKWNKIEHRLFSFIAMNWRGKPLVSHDVIINLIRSTKTKKGLSVEGQLDTNEYQTGIKVSDEQLRSLDLVTHDSHGEWNYTINPQR